MNKTGKDYSNPTSMVDYNLLREWDARSISVTVYDGDDTDLDNLLHQGYRVLDSVTIL